MVPGWDLVTPPELTRYYPVVNVFHPTNVGIVKARWVEVNGIVPLSLLSGNGLLSQRPHADEPLRRQARFYYHTSPFRVTHRV